MRENLRGLRENLKYKFRFIVESGCVRVVNDVQFDFDVVDIIENPLIPEMDQGNLLKSILTRKPVEEKENSLIKEFLLMAYFLQYANCMQCCLVSKS